MVKQKSFFVKITFWLVAFGPGFFGGPYARADSFNLDNLFPDDIKDLSKELSANFMHTSVSPAHGLGSIFGLELGLIGGLTKTPKFESLVKEQDPDSEIDAIPHGGLFLAMTVPFNLTFEALTIPSIEAENAKIKTLSMGLKWQYSELPEFKKFIPFDASLRLHFNLAELSYTDTVNNASTLNQDVEATISLENRMWGADLLVSYDFIILEPYIGMGYLGGATSLGITGSADVTIFNTSASFSDQQNFESQNDSFRFLAGAQVDLFLLHAALEYAAAFSTSRVTLKGSIYF